MADLDAGIDALYQGPLDAFTDARNALAKSAKRADVKALQKPSLPAWAVNQLFWHRRADFDRLIAAATAVRDAHGRTLAGKAADVRAAEQAHREVLREVLEMVRSLIAAGGHPTTPATLDAVRDTLQVLPSPEANGRLTRPLAPTGFAALAGIAVAPGRPDLRVVPAKAKPSATDATANADDAEDAAADAEAAQARARREAERAERERRKAAEKALEAARAVLQRAEIALDDAERVAAKRRAERDLAAAAHEKAKQALDR